MSWRPAMTGSRGESGGAGSAPRPGGGNTREGGWGRAASPTSRFLRATLGHDGGEEGGNRSRTDRKRPRAGARGRTTNHFLALAIAWWEAAPRRGLAFSFGHRRLCRPLLGPGG